MSEFRRRLMMARKTKPYDAEVEYLQSSGIGCYIDTCMLITSTTNVEIRYGIAQTHAEAGADVRFFYANEGSGYICQGFLTGSEKVRTRWGSSSDKEVNAAKNDIFTFLVENSKYVNFNETKGLGETNAIGSTYPTNTTLKLADQMSSRIYSAKIGSLNLIPVRKGQVGYLYDKNSGTLYSQQGSGQPFVLGSDKAKIDGEIEYIECDGSAYINTGVKVASNVQFEFFLEVPDYSGESSAPWLFGGRDTGGSTQLGLLLNSNGTHQWRYGSGSISVTNVSNSVIASNIDTARSLVMNGTTISASAATFSTQFDFYLFCFNAYGRPTLRANGMRFKRGKIWSNGTLVRDYVPVKRNGVGYLYDKVSGTLFGNANDTGAFILGNDK